jgi:hypothetical protein
MMSPSRKVCGLFGSSLDPSPPCEGTRKVPCTEPKSNSETHSGFPPALPKHTAACSREMLGWSNSTSPKRPKTKNFLWFNSIVFVSFPETKHSSLKTPAGGRAHTGHVNLLNTVGATGDTTVESGSSQPQSLLVCLCHRHTNIRMHSCTHAHMHTCTHAHMHTCTHIHIHSVCLSARKCVLKCVCVRACFPPLCWSQATY